MENINFNPSLSTTKILFYILFAAKIFNIRLDLSWLIVLSPIFAEIIIFLLFVAGSTFFNKVNK
jgi:hypothetical protein